MDIVIGSDHAGFRLKSVIKDFLLNDCSLRVLDVGTHSEEPVDYPDFGVAVADMISQGKCEKGILICGSGIGMSIIANKFSNVRAALCLDVENAKFSKAHNNANILVLAGRKTTTDNAKEIVKIWLQTPFTNEERHLKRLAKIVEIEKNNR
ncbi:MAG: ribose 5-phosphate isomerase B [Deltaproteobacteria bacterium]